MIPLNQCAQYIPSLSKSLNLILNNDTFQPVCSMRTAIVQKFKTDFR